MREQDRDDERLEGFFEAARMRAPEPSDALLDRIAADALRELPRRVAPAPSFRMRLMEILGGWQGLGGLVTATAAGLWIGYAGLADPVALVTENWSSQTETVELMPGAEVFALAVAEGI